MKLLPEVLTSAAEIQTLRQHLHAHPELAFEENKTADLIASKLSEFGIQIHRGLAKTGVIGVIKAGSSQRAIGLRADMDALPIQEKNLFSYSSQHPGKMHACGHDGHVAMLLAAAKYLQNTRHFDGTVYLIFQPAEEGGGGAQKMIEQGLFEQFPMQAVFGMHNWPGLKVGHFGVRPGAMMASSNEFKITIHGKGGHAAIPHQSFDPIMAATQLAQSLQTIVARNINPLDNAVLSITQIHAGDTNNVIPDMAWLAGTVRTFSTEILDLIENRMRALTEHTALALGCSADFKFERNYPPTINHETETLLCTQVMNDLVGEDSVHCVEPTMGAEDFSFMLQKKPGCYVFIGNGDVTDKSKNSLGPCQLHNAHYDFNDELIPIGATYWINLVERYLK